MWWQSLSSFQHVILVIAASATLLLVIFLILLLLGIGDDSSFDGGDFDDVDFDLYNDEPLTSFTGLKILTVRGALTLLSVGGWTAFLLDDVLDTWLALLIGVVVGVVAAYLLALAFRLSLRLESSGNIDYKNAIGKTAKVYLRIPKNKLGAGKVTLVLQERLVEISAVTEDSEDISSNSIVEVVGLEDDHTLIVKRK